MRSEINSQIIKLYARLASPKRTKEKQIKIQKNNKNISFVRILEQEEDIFNVLSYFYLFFLRPPKAYKSEITNLSASLQATASIT